MTALLLDTHVWWWTIMTFVTKDEKILDYDGVRAVWWKTDNYQYYKVLIGAAHTSLRNFLTSLPL